MPSLSWYHQYGEVWGGVETAPNGTYKTSDPDLWGRYLEACEEHGIDEHKLDVLSDDGLWFALSQGANSVLFCSPEIMDLSQDNIHKTSLSLFSRPKIISNSPELGEILLTNIGIGDPEAYAALHTARARSALWIAQNLSLVCRQIFDTNEDMVETLSRAVATTTKSYPRDKYNPLLHALLEGIMTVGQAVNYFVQPGIETQTSTIADMRQTLQSNMPMELSKILPNGYIGPDQLAGLSVHGMTERTAAGLQIAKSMRDRYSTIRKNEKEKRDTMQPLTIQALQDPRTQAVNRGFGCPATRLVRTMSGILLDALAVS